MMFTAEYILKSLPLEWPDVLWGNRHQLIGWTVPIDLAHARLDSRLTDDDLEIELSQVGKDDDFKVGRIIEALATRDPVPEEVSKRKWLYLTLLWLYENHDHIDDPFDEISGVYIDFGHPDEILPLLPDTSPPTGIDINAETPTENYNRRLREWKDYLDRTKIGFATKDTNP